MKLYIITREPFPDGLAATNRIKCYAKAYISQGVDCEVIIYGRNNFDEYLLPKGLAEGIPYEFIGGGVHRLKGKWKAKIQSFSLFIRLLYFLFYTLKTDDVVLGYNEGPGMLIWLLLKVIHLRKAFYISELCELPYGTGLENSRTRAQRIFAYKHLFPKYDGIIAISKPLADEAHKHCSKRTIIIKVPILVDFDYFDIPDRSSEADFPYIFHAGTLYEQKDGIIGMIEAFGLATRKLNTPIHFVLTGDIDKSPHKEEIKTLISKYNLEGLIHFLGYVTHEDLKKYLSKSTLVIINKYPTQQNMYCFSTKLGEYMAAGKPLIITKIGEAMNWLTNGYDSIIVEANNITQLSDAIIYSFSNVKSIKTMGNNARNSCKQFFDYRNNSVALSDMLKQIIYKKRD